MLEDELIDDDADQDPSPPTTEEVEKVAKEEEEEVRIRNRVVTILTENHNQVCTLDELEVIVEKEFVEGVDSCIGPILLAYEESCQDSVFFCLHC